MLPILHNPTTSVEARLRAACLYTSAAGNVPERPQPRPLPGGSGFLFRPCTKESISLVGSLIFSIMCIYVAWSRTCGVRNMKGQGHC